MSIRDRVQSGTGDDVSNNALGLLYGHSILTIYEDLLL